MVLLHEHTQSRPEKRRGTGGSQNKREYLESTKAPLRCTLDTANMAKTGTVHSKPLAMPSETYG